MAKMINADYIDELAKEMSNNTIIGYEELPKYDLFCPR